MVKITIRVKSGSTKLSKNPKTGINEITFNIEDFLNIQMDAHSAPNCPESLKRIPTRRS
jgi:hypothetical protein